MSKHKLEHEIGLTDIVVFLHLPKTAGITLSSYLENCFDHKEVSPFLFNETLYQIPSDHLRGYKFIRGHFYFDVIRQLLQSPPICITMLRNPVHRVVSTYEFVKRNSETVSRLIGRDEVTQLLELSLSEFVRNPTQSFKNQIPNGQIRQMAEKYQLSQAEGETKLAARLSQPADLQTAVTLLESFEFFGLTERFQESLFLMAYIFGWPPQTRIIARNTNPDRKYQETLSSTVLDEIARHNALDQEFYEHARTLFEQRLGQMTDALLEQYGGKQHAHLQQPVPMSVLQDLLEQHYERRYKARHRSTKRIHFGFEKATYHSNWHKTQHPVTSSSCQWIRTGTMAAVDIPIQAEVDLAFLMKVAKVSTRDLHANISIKANGCQLSLRPLPNEVDIVLYAGIIPGSACTGDRPFIRIEVEINGVQSDGDMRVGVEWLDIRPATVEEIFQSYTLQLAEAIHDLTNNQMQNIALRRQISDRSEQISILRNQLAAVQYVADVASREVEAVHNSKPWKLAKIYWRWRDQVKRALGIINSPKTK